MMELISKEVVKRIIDSGRTMEQMLKMVENAVAVDNKTEHTEREEQRQTCAVRKFRGEYFNHMADEIDHMIDTICELGNGISEEDVKKESKILYEIRDQLYEVGGWNGNEPEQTKKYGPGYWIDYQEGIWIYAKCSKCGTVQDARSKYCPACGCLMEG